MPVQSFMANKFNSLVLHGKQQLWVQGFGPAYKETTSEYLSI